MSELLHKSSSKRWAKKCDVGDFFIVWSKQGDRGPIFILKEAMDDGTVKQICQIGIYHFGLAHEEVAIEGKPG